MITEASALSGIERRAGSGTTVRGRAGWRWFGWILALGTSVGCQAPAAPMTEGVEAEAGVEAEVESERGSSPALVESSEASVDPGAEQDEDYVGSPVAPFDYFDGLRCSAAIPTPEEGLGHSIGAHFTRQPDMLSYLESIE